MVSKRQLITTACKLKNLPCCSCKEHAAEKEFQMYIVDEIMLFSFSTMSDVYNMFHLLSSTETLAETSLASEPDPEYSWAEMLVVTTFTAQ